MEMLEENPSNVKRAEIIVGIPSYNEAKSIAYPTQQSSLGLVRYFRNKSSVIINCDNFSEDGTKDAFMKTKTEVPKIYISTPKGVNGKGNNLKNLFKKAMELKAQAILIVDADLKSITPQWIKNLGEPLFLGYGFVAPLYIRHKLDGTITNNIAYPLTRALYGRRVRQPIGGDFGFSGEMAEYFLKFPLWNEEVAHFGIDIWMTTVAMNTNLPICQTFMGGPKTHKPKDPSADLGPMFREVVGTIFTLMDIYSPFWKRVKWSKPTSIFGFGLGETELPPPVNVNMELLYKKFKDGFKNYQDSWASILSEDVYRKLLEVKELNESFFDFPNYIWAKVLFDYAVAFKNNKGKRDELLNSLVPLYYGKVYSYALRVDDMTTKQAEEYIEEMCYIFEENKPYLIERWDRS